MAYSRAARAAREAAFRQSHGMSSGAWYSMRRKAEQAGISPKQFDKAKGDKGIYDAMKKVVRTKREAPKNRGGEARRRIQDAIDQLPPNIQITWGTP